MARLAVWPALTLVGPRTAHRRWLANARMMDTKGASIVALSATARERFLNELDDWTIGPFRSDWTQWAGKGQTPPRGAHWCTWLFLGGRGSGKTRAGAEWVKAQVRTGAARRVALIAPTLHDAREIMIAGPSGLLADEDEPPRFEVSRRRLVWPNGAEAHFFSAEDPWSLRGPQFDAAWADEFAYWAKPKATLDNLMLALRLGERPRLVVTTTPRPLEALRRLREGAGVVITRATTFDNSANLAPGFVADLRARFAGTVDERQEVLGEYIEDQDGPLWSRALIEASRRAPAVEFDRIVVAVDPPVSIGAGAAACGIIAAGGYGAHPARRAVVLADASVQGLGPHAWAERAAGLARALNADAIVAEGNNGGELVRSVLRIAAPDIAIRLVHASRGKYARAEPIASCYARGLVTHAAPFPALEDEMCAFGADGYSKSPDRLDALVWALWDLLIADARPRLRTL